MSENSKMHLWDAVKLTNPDNVKNVNSFTTAIDSLSQIKKATEQWGSQGDKWGLKNLNYKTMPIGEEILLTLEANFFYPNGRIEIASSIMLKEKGKKTDTDAFKKVRTDCLSKAFSQLGFNADVFSGKFQDSKYVQRVAKSTKLLTAQNLKEKLAKIKDMDGLTSFFNMNPQIQDDKALLKLFTARKLQIDPRAKERAIQSRKDELSKEIARCKSVAALAAIQKNNIELLKGDEDLQQAIIDKKEQLDG